MFYFFRSKLLPRVHPSAASPIGISEQIRRDELDLVQVWSLTILSLVLVKYKFTSLLRENIDLYGFCNRFHALVLSQMPFGGFDFLWTLP